MKQITLSLLLALPSQYSCPRVRLSHKHFPPFIWNFQKFFLYLHRESIDFAYEQRDNDKTDS